jgi:hypothetical protein
VLDDPGYQTTLPAVSRSGEGSLGGPAEEGAAPILAPVVGALAPLALIVLYVLAGAAVLLFLSWIALEALSRRRGRRLEPGARAQQEREEGEGAPESEAVLDDASRLAAEGRYGEAIHVLLLVAIRHLAERSRVALPPSRTSREIARLLPLGAESRPIFAELVRSVELSLFGGVPAGPEDYERSLERFRALVRRPV